MAVHGVQIPPASDSALNDYRRRRLMFPYSSEHITVLCRWPSFARLMLNVHGSVYLVVYIKRWWVYVASWIQSVPSNDNRAEKDTLWTGTSCTFPVVTNSLVHGQVTIIFVVSVCLSVCLFVCLFVCAAFFSAVFDPISIKLGHTLYVWV